MGRNIRYIVFSDVFAALQRSIYELSSPNRLSFRLGLFVGEFVCLAGLSVSLPAELLKIMDKFSWIFLSIRPFDKKKSNKF